MLQFGLPGRVYQVDFTSYGLASGVVEYFFMSVHNDVCFVSCGIDSYRVSTSSFLVPLFGFQKGHFPYVALDNNDGFRTIHILVVRFVELHHSKNVIY